MMTTRTRTILRIKRRRTETPVSCIQLEGLTKRNDSGGNVNLNDGPSAGNEAPLQDQSAIGELKQQLGQGQQRSRLLHSKNQQSSVALWKRVVEDENVNDGNCNYDSAENAITTKGQKRGIPCETYRIVDAMFVSGGEDRSDHHQNHINNEEDSFCGEGDPRSNKRRKLTLLDSSMTIAADSPVFPGNSNLSSSSTMASTLKHARQLQQQVRTKSPKKRLKVLDPWTRIVDDSLKSVRQGKFTVESHYQQLTTDPRFTLQDVSKQRAWMSWSLQDDGTNILHCCALWNDSSTANNILQQYCNRFPHHRRNLDQYSKLRSELMEAVDVEGRTPYELAKLIGHVRVCEVLEMYGGDTSNYVYDMYYLDRPPSHDDNGNGANHCATNHATEPSTKDDSTRANTKENTINFDSVKDCYDHDDAKNTYSTILRAELTKGLGFHWTPEGEFVFETSDDENECWDDDGDDMDSNCEEYGANDYPEEERCKDDENDRYYDQEYDHQWCPQRYEDEGSEADFDGGGYGYSNDRYDEYD